MIKPKRYRKKPVVIEAIQWTGDNWFQIDEFVGFDCDTHPRISQITIPTKEGDMVASVGDWIIKGIKGEFYPCKPDIFEKTYADEADESFKDFLKLI